MHLLYMITDIGWLSRTEILIGREKLNKLIGAHVLVVGMGGVGSFAAEFLCRSGIGELTIVDGDTIDPSNINRQLPALAINCGQPKVEVMAQRLLQINPNLGLHIIKEFIMPGKVEKLLNTNYDYVIDAIDSITPKTTFIVAAYNKKIRLISSMGAGGKFDPTIIKVADISQTYNCPFAQQIRKYLKAEGIYSGIKTVFSPEIPPKESLIFTDGNNFKKSAYGTMSYMPAAFGGVVSSVVLKDLMEI